LVQKEVAERIVGQNQSRINPKENLLSISVKVYSEPKLIKTVKAGSFLPIPKVDSAILKLSNISKKVFEENNISEEKFFTFVKAGFSHNRKKLSSNLEKLVDKKEFEKYLIKEKMNPSTRAEDLSLENWIKIVKKFI
jgi:16S rRNA (adenine1518-N6/adenine1519-N6)-dimethyltransferase